MEWNMRLLTQLRKQKLWPSCPILLWRWLGLKPKVNLANAIISRAVGRYGASQVMLCFNGGKDCTVVLDLLSKQHCLQQESLNALYVRGSDDFVEVDRFIKSCKQRYNLHLMCCNGPMLVAIEQALVQMPHRRVMLLGNRRTDPGCAHLQYVMPSDNGWPPLMRVFPLLDWSYSDIWSYLLCQKVPYCCLYDTGYTSLGGRNSTNRNLSLLKFDKRKQRFVFRPAYALDDDTLERANRNASSNL